MAKTKSSGAKGVTFDTTGLSFREIPKSETAVKNNAKKVTAALRDGKMVVFKSANGDITTFTRNSDKTYTSNSSRSGERVLSEEMGRSAIASFFVGKKDNRKFAIK